MEGYGETLPYTNGTAKDRNQYQRCVIQETFNVESVQCILCDAKVTEEWMHHFLKYKFSKVCSNQIHNTRTHLSRFAIALLK